MKSIPLKPQEMRMCFPINSFTFLHYADVQGKQSIPAMQQCDSVGGDEVKDL